MNRCTALRPLSRPLGRAPTQFCQCRQKSEGFSERPSPFFRRHEFARKTEKGLKGYDKKLKVDSINKTVGTSVGDLPISPVMDPRWMEARTRYRTPKPRRPKDVLPAGRFRKKLEANPYALALSTPVRFCPVSQTHLPKYFLQELKPIQNPETNGYWWTPGDLDVLYAAKEWERDDEPSVEGDPPEPPDPARSPVAQQKATEKLLRRSPASYVLARKPLLQSLSGTRKKTPHGEKWRSLLSKRQGSFAQNFGERQVWREDMDDFVLENMRRNVMKYLVYFAELRAGEDRRSYLLRLGSWEKVATIPQRGCLLWYQSENGPRKQDAGAESGGDTMALEQFATYDVPKAKYEKKLPVYDLRRLLGEEYLAKLREIPMFRDSSLFLLRKQRSIPLQLYLWKLQAYMAEYDAPDDVYSWNSTHNEDPAVPALPKHKGYMPSRDPNSKRDSESSAFPSTGRKDPKQAWQSQAGFKKDWIAAVSSSAPPAPGRKGL
ncbi:esterase-like protein [Colletotrichum tofieldiae]|uniref:Esterase-like protein n=1 Tax=Colletotrichum tofieldiae TaxID=708197 RepID=A0A166VV68_9PEZI|nr:esterase-like protein [Colletotrichum tofieldiae]GKT94920.1 esterase-like protein [Colletotrichum tofieldiae]